MNWINLETSTLDSPEFLGAEPIERATWLCLMRYCVGQENGGRIAKCRDWKDRRWQQLVRVTAREIGSSCDLWKWDGDDLEVFAYPIEKEAEVKQRRETAKANGRNGGRPSKNQQGAAPKTDPGSLENPAETDVGFSPEPTLANSAKAEEKRKEWNGREGEEARERVPSPTPSPKPVVVDLPAETPAERGTLYPIDRITVQLAGVWPSAPRHMTGAEMHALHDSLRVLNEFTDDDWIASRAWIEAPNRVRGCALWPRSRSEFVSHSGEAIEKIRRWWSHGGGRSWWASKKTPGPSPTREIRSHGEEPAPAGDFTSKQEAHSYFQELKNGKP